MDLGAFELDAGRPERAFPLLERCAELSRRRDQHNRHIGWALAELAEAAIELGNHERARGALDEAATQFEYYGDVLGPKYIRGLEERLAMPQSG